MSVIFLFAFLITFYANISESYGYFSLILAPIYVGSFAFMFIAAIVYWLMQRTTPQSERRSRLVVIMMRAILLVSMISAWILWNLRRDEGAGPLEVAALAFPIAIAIVVVHIHNMTLSIEKKE
jgi:hypothetical protein